MSNFVTTQWATRNKTVNLEQQYLLQTARIYHQLLREWPPTLRDWTHGYRLPPNARRQLRPAARCPSGGVCWCVMMRPWRGRRRIESDGWRYRVQMLTVNCSQHQENQVYHVNTRLFYRSNDIFCKNIMERPLWIPWNFPAAPHSHSMGLQWQCWHRSDTGVTFDLQKIFNHRWLHVCTY